MQGRVTHRKFRLGTRKGSYFCSAFVSLSICCSFRNFGPLQQYCAVRNGWPCRGNGGGGGGTSKCSTTSALSKRRYSRDERRHYVGSGRHSVTIQRAFDPASGINDQMVAMLGQELQNSGVHARPAAVLWQPCIRQARAKCIYRDRRQACIDPFMGLANSVSPLIKAFSKSTYTEIAGECQSDCFCVNSPIVSRQPAPPQLLSGMSGEDGDAQIVFYRSAPAWGLPSLSAACIHVQARMTCAIDQFGTFHYVCSDLHRARPLPFGQGTRVVESLNAMSLACAGILTASQHPALRRRLRDSQRLAHGYAILVPQRSYPVCECSQ